MRRPAVFLAALALAPAAHAAPPAVTATATPADRRRAAAGDADRGRRRGHLPLGPRRRRRADEPVVQHTYAAGRFTARARRRAPPARPPRRRSRHRDRAHPPRPGQRALPAARALPRRLVPRRRRAHRPLPQRTRGSRPSDRPGGSFVVRGRVGTRTRGTRRATRSSLEPGRAGGAARPRHRLQRLRPARQRSRCSCASARPPREGKRQGLARPPPHPNAGLPRPPAPPARHGPARASTACKWRSRPAAGYIAARRALQRFVFAASLGPGSSGLKRLCPRPPAARAPLRARPGRRLLRPGRRRRDHSLPEAARPAAHRHGRRPRVAGARAGPRP